MMVKILGGSGGVCPGNQATSYLIDGKLLIDAGSVATTLSVEDQAQVQWILISHTHLDHIKDLAFITDNCIGMKARPFEVYTSATSKSIIETHFFNNKIWPDFTQIPSKDHPTIRFQAVKNETTFNVGNYTITAVAVNHPNEAFGYIIESGGTVLVFTQDTGPTDRIWELANKRVNLKAIFTEVSFPNELRKVAKDSQHHTPETVKSELMKMPPEVPVYLGHLKPHFRQILIEEVMSIGSDRLNILSAEDQTISF